MILTACPILTLNKDRLPEHQIHVRPLSITPTTVTVLHPHTNRCTSINNLDTPLRQLLLLLRLANMYLRILTLNISRLVPTYDQPSVWKVFKTIVSRIP